MNYRFVHDRLIERAMSRGKPDGYCERHHIVPKSMGGSDGATNLVWLTAREHYLVHWLLFKIHRNKETVYAWHRMTHSKKSVSRYTSYSYEYAKRAKALFQSMLFTGRRLSPEHRKKLSEAKRGRSYADQGRDLSTSRKGQTLTPEQKARIGAASRGRKLSAETRKKISESKMGAKNPRYGKPAHNRKELEAKE